MVPADRERPAHALCGAGGRLAVAAGRGALGLAVALGRFRWAASAGRPGGNGWRPRARPEKNRDVTDSWMLDELAHAGPEHLDAAAVLGFDRKQGYPDAGPDLDALAALGLGPSSRVVDLGAGTGQFAIPAAARFGQVTAVDVSPAMLAALREKAAAAGLANLDCVHAGFLGYSHAGPPADGVYTRNALHQIPDFFKALALHRIAGMLRPGGVLRLRDLVFDFEPGQASETFAGWFAAAAADPAEGYTAGDYAEHIRTEFSTYRWLLEPMLAVAGFEIVSVEFERRLYGAYTCVRRLP